LRIQREFSFVPLLSPVFLYIDYDVKADFNTISHEYHAQIVNCKPPSLCSILHYTRSRASSTNGEKKNTYVILVGKPKGNRPIGRPKRRWVDNIKMDLR
jgi:hypothetical protein